MSSKAANLFALLAEVVVRRVVDTVAVGFVVTVDLVKEIAVLLMSVGHKNSVEFGVINCA